jgi:hypothetical protein
MIDLSVRPSRRRAVTAHVLLGLLLQFVFVVQSLVILPLCIRMIGAGPFGFWLASGGILSWLAIANFGSAGLTMQRCAAAYGRSDLAGARDWFMHGVVVATASGAVLLALLLPVAALTPTWLGARGSVAAALSSGMVIAGCGAALAPLNDTARGFVCALQRNSFAMGAELAAAAISLVFTIWALLAGWGITGLAWGSLLRMALALGLNAVVATLCATQAEASTRWSRAIMAEYGKTLGPLWGASVVGQLVPQLPLVVLAKALGPEIGPAASLAYTTTTRPIALAEMFTMHAISSTSSAITHLVEDPHAAGTASARVRAMSSAVYAAIAGGVALYCLGDEGFVNLWVGHDAFLGQAFVLAAAVASVASIQLRWLMNLGTSLGMVASTAVFQAVEGVARATAMIVGVACLGPIGIPLAGAVVMVCGASFIERRLAEHRAFPAAGTGRWGWLLRAVVACGVACLAARYMPRADWVSWAAGMTLGGLAAASAVLAASSEIRGWVRGWSAQQINRFRAV